jgi:hypothetical protein
VGFRSVDLFVLPCPLCENNILLHCMKRIPRNTVVVSVSLPEATAKKLEEARKRELQSRSSFIGNLIEQAVEESRWQRIFRKGRETAERFTITSEDDIDAILHSS